MFGKKSKNGKGSCVSLNDGKVTIDCNGCPGASDPSERGCIVCICGRVSCLGEFDTIVLRSSVDVAIGGEAVSCIRELAFIHRMMSDNRSDRKGRRCCRCKRSFSAVVKDQLETFPEVDVALLRDRVSQMQFPDQVCTMCAGDTVKMISTIEETLDGIGVSDSPLCREVE